MKISLIGLGAIGASYAAILNRHAGVDLTVVLDDDRLKRYREQELLVNGAVQTFNYVGANEASEPADLVIIAVKYQDLPDAIQAVKHHVGEQTTIMSLLNGIDSEEIIGEVYGMDKMLYSMCLGIDAQRSGLKVDYGSAGRIVFGEKSGELTDRVEKIKKTFELAGVPYECPKDMYKKLWWKFMINVCSNQPTAILGANYHYLNTQHGHELMAMIVQEVRAVALKKGVEITDEDFKAWLVILEKMVPESKTSMLQDIDAGRLTEVDMFAGVIRKLGAELGVSTPYNDMMYHMLKMKEQINRK
ncbi:MULTISPECIES: ketopantoate reductase family protein [unclassified Fusibacter]|uniref:ketopantoate reductase family protein n=1 Tax=unclassified Fusibacter TaxID=2624464 RepID=UPI0013E991E2|nr:MULTISPECIES: ketopantoate reductase family protein [unclassified Fusibacter]MCK8061588.1 ketopantoate reductase family protein [Fusibacter sp. A2]NPE23771.1 ketopantoate reductase family protein [Fusibacter sp. A1]